MLFRENDQKDLYVFNTNTRIFFNYLFIYLFIYLFLVGLGLCCGMWAFSNFREQGLLFVAVLDLLIAMACFVVEHIL